VEDVRLPGEQGDRLLVDGRPVVEPVRVQHHVAQQGVRQGAHPDAVRGRLGGDGRAGGGQVGGDGPSRIEDGGPACEVAATSTTAGRGTGVLDTARSIRSGEPHRATGELALHVLAVMEAIEAAAAAGTPVEVAVGAPTPQALPEDGDPYRATLPS